MRTRWLTPLAAALAATPAAGGAGSAALRRAAERVTLTNHPLNRHIRMLDGQWQGTFLASDGNRDGRFEGFAK